MGKLYDIFKASKLGAGAAPDFYTALIGQSFSKGSAQEYELTDVPPLSFNSNGQPLSDWEIEGASVGDPTNNLFDYSSYTEASSKVTGIVIDKYKISYTASGQYTAIKYTFPINPSDVFKLSLESSSQNTRLELRYMNGSEQVGNTIIVLPGNSATIAGAAEYDSFRLYISNGTYIGVCTASIMLSSGSASKEYEPYGFKIPVICGGQTTNIYIDSPLSTGESISKAETSVDIPTIDGSNTLSVDTTVQPSQMYIKYYK